MSHWANGSRSSFWLVIAWHFVRLKGIFSYFPMTSRIRSIGFTAAFVSVFAGATMVLAQTFPSSSPYTQCVAPHIRSYEDQVYSLQQAYEQQILQLVRQRADARIIAWTIPERSARNRAIRNADKIYRDGVRAANRSYKDQLKVLNRQFSDAEDVCDDQFDNDVEDGGGFSSSSYSNGPVCGNHICESGEGFYCPPCDTYGCTNSCAVGTCPQDCPTFSSSSSSRSSSSSFVSCFQGDMCIPYQSCTSNVGTIVSPGTCGNQSQTQAGYYCCRPKTSSSSSRSSSRSSSATFISCFGNDSCVPQQSCFNAGGTIASPGACGNQSQVNAGYACCRISSNSRSSSSSSWVFYPNDDGRSQAQQIESCGCQTVCDPSGTSCMAVCPAEC